VQLKLKLFGLTKIIVDGEYACLPLLPEKEILTAVTGVSMDGFRKMLVLNRRNQLWHFNGKEWHESLSIRKHYHLRQYRSQFVKTDLYDAMLQQEQQRQVEFDKVGYGPQATIFECRTNRSY